MSYIVPAQTTPVHSMIAQVPFVQDSSTSVPVRAISVSRDNDYLVAGLSFRSLRGKIEGMDGSREKSQGID